MTPHDSLTFSGGGAVRGPDYQTTGGGWLAYSSATALEIRASSLCRVEAVLAAAVFAASPSRHRLYPHTHRTSERVNEDIEPHNGQVMISHDFNMYHTSYL